MKIKTSTHTIDSRKVRNAYLSVWKMNQKLNKRHGKNPNAVFIEKTARKALDMLKNRPGAYQRNCVEA